MKNQTEMIAILLAGNPKHFTKHGVFTFYIAIKEHEVITSIAGKEETRNIALPGDYVLKGISGEKYVVHPEAFAKRYKVTSTNSWNQMQANDDHENEGSAIATGECYGIVWESDDDKFESPWGGDMIINKGDMLVSPDDKFTQAYRIAIDEFNKTYVPALVDLSTSAGNTIYSNIPSQSTIV